MKSETLEKPINIRLSPDLKARLAKIAQANNINVADALRICLAQGLPRVEAGQIFPVREEEKVAA